MQRQPLMRVRIEESDPARLRQMARDWGIKAVEGQHPDVLAVAIANAYRRERDKSDALHDRESR